MILQPGILARQMKTLFLTLLGVLLITLLATPTLGAGWLWDIANGMGFVGFAGLLCLSIPTRSTMDVQAHQLLGYVVLGVVTAHALWFLMFDAAAIEYIKLGAPTYMWGGIISFLLLAILIFIGLPQYRLRVYINATAKFKYWHRILGIATIAGACYHITASGFYLNTDLPNRTVSHIDRGCVIPGPEDSINRFGDATRDWVFDCRCSLRGVVYRR